MAAGHAISFPAIAHNEVNLENISFAPLLPLRHVKTDKRIFYKTQHHMSVYGLHEGLMDRGI